jgi:hypothetical protein
MTREQKISIRTRTIMAREERPNPGRICNAPDEAALHRLALTRPARRAPNLSGGTPIGSWQKV